jgi:hypothetical protein
MSEYVVGRIRNWCLILLLEITLAGCHQAPSTMDLSYRFREHRAKFEHLVQMSEEDSGFRKLPDDGLSSGLMPVQRTLMYRGTLSALGLSGPIFRHSQHPYAVFIYADSWVSIREQPMEIGYVYSPKEILRTFTRLDAPSAVASLFHGSTPCIAFVPLEERWYIFLSVGEKGMSGLPPPCN